MSPKAEKVNGWREDLQHYERNLEEMTSVNLDQVRIYIHENDAELIKRRFFFSSAEF